MTPIFDFDLENIKTTEFGIGTKTSENYIFGNVPVNIKVKDELQKFTSTTWDMMQNDEGGAQEYDPSNETASTKYIYLRLSSEMAHVFRELQQAENLKIISNLSNISGVFCYFTRFTDDDNRRLTAIRKTTQFASLKKGYISWIDGTLQLVKNPIFKLDAIFDLLIDSKFVHILHPKSFESIGNLKRFVLNSVEKNTDAIQQHLPFVDVDPVKEYATAHIRAARYLASIQARGWAVNIGRSALEKACIENNVKITNARDSLDISEDVNGFLEVLDRRRYSVGLVPNTLEQFRAASRHVVNA